MTTSTYQSVDQFKTDTLAIAKHLNTLKVGQLRQAVAKANGFNSVEAYTNSLSSQGSNVQASAGGGSGEITGIKRYRNKLIFTAEAVTWNAPGEPMADTSDASDEEISEYLTGFDDLYGIERFDRGGVSYVSGYFHFSRMRFWAEPQAVSAIEHFIAQFQGQCQSTAMGIFFVDCILNEMRDEKASQHEWLSLLYQSVLEGPRTVLEALGEGHNELVDGLMHALLDAPAPLLFFHPYQLANAVNRVEDEDDEDGLLDNDPMHAFEEIAFAELMGKRVVWTLNVAMQALKAQADKGLFEGKPLSEVTADNEKLLKEAMRASFFLNKPVSFENLFDH